MPQLWTNNAVSTLTTALTATSTVMSVATGDGTLFPNPTSTVDFFVITLESGSNREIVQVQTRSTDSFTDITRAQEGTSAQVWATGVVVELRLTRDGVTRLHTTSEVKRLLVNEWVGDLTNPPINGFVGYTPTMDFDATTRQLAYATFGIPPEMAASTTALFRLSYTISTATAGSIVMAGNWTAFAAASAEASSTGTGFTSTITSTASTNVSQVVNVATIAASNFANNNTITVRLYRDATHASDTNTGNFRMITFEMEYLTRRGAA